MADRLDTEAPRPWRDFQHELADLKWLGSLARRLVADPALAEDACQEAWISVESSGRGDPDGSSRRPQLLRAMRRFVWRRHRGEARRRRREQGAARTEALPSTSELILRGEQRERLWRHLKGLDEPYRTTLLLRYQEDLDTAEIASRQDVARDTVRWRLRRGLELLRESLGADVDGGGLPAIVAAIPLGFGGVPAPDAIPPALGGAAAKAASGSVGFGALSMGKAVLGSSLVALVLVSGVAAWLSDGTSESPTHGESAPPGDAAVALTEVSDGEVVVPEPPRAPSRVEAPVRVDAVPENTSASMALLRGRVVDAQGSPLTGTEVLVAAPDRWERTGSCDTDGHFRIETPIQTVDEIEVILRAGAMHQVGYRRLGTTAHCDQGPLVDANVSESDLGEIRLGGAGVLRGRLVDGEGLGFAGGSISLRSIRGRVDSDGGGWFEWSHVPPGMHRLQVNARGHLDLDREVEVEVGRTTDLGELRLEPGPRVRGIVTDLEGRPLGEATVSTRGFTRHWVFETDGRGGFDVPMPDRAPCNLYARAPGYIQSQGVSVDPGAEHVHVRLEHRGVSVAFELVDARTGEPIQQFGARLHRGADLPHDDPRYESPGGSDPSASKRPGGRVSTVARPGVDRIGFAAPGYMSKHVPITEAATDSGSQRVRLTPSPGIVGRIVEGGRGVAGQEVVLQFGDLCVLGDLSRDGATVPLPQDHPLKPALDAQWGYPRLQVWPVEDPLPPLRVGSMTTHPSYRRTLTDAEGRFFFNDLEIGGAEVFAKSKDGRGFVRSGVLGVEPGGFVDLGSLPWHAPATILGTLVPTGPGELGGHTVLLYADQRREARTDGSGSFEFRDLPPGRHFLHVQAGEGLYLPRIRSQSFHVEVEAGESRELEVRVVSAPVCELDLVVLCNGTPVAKGQVSFESLDPRFESMDVELDASGRGTVELPARVPLRGLVTLGDADLQWGPVLELSPGAEHLEVALETGELEVLLPAGFEAEGRTRARLEWSSEAGDARSPIRTTRLAVRGGEAEAAEGSLHWPHVPASARDLELVIEVGEPYGDLETLLRAPVEVPIRRGERVRFALP